MAKRKDKFEKKNAGPDVRGLDKMYQIPVQDIVVDKELSETDITKIEMHKIFSILDKTGDSINETAGAFEMHPEIGMIEEILISSILSPKELVEPTLNISVHKNAPPSFASKIQEHFKTEYDLDSKLSKFLSKSLFREGAVPLLIITPKIISDLIARNTKNIKMDGMDVPEFRSGPYIVRENVDILEGIDITGDVGEVEFTNDLSMANAGDFMEAYRMYKKDKILLDSYGYDNSASKYFDNRISVKTEIDELRTHMEITEKEDNERQSLYDAMNPIIMELPMDSILPICKPGNPEEHIDYLLFLDSNYNPLSKAKDSNYMKDLNRQLEERVKNTISPSSNTSSNGITVNVSGSSGSKVRTHDDNRIEETAFDIYIKNFESKLRNNIASSKGIKDDSNIQFEVPDELYRIMFSRQLAKQKTTILHIPRELMTYIAFDHNTFGIGLSLMEKSKLYTIIRSAIMFATLLASVHGSIPNRKLNITLDEYDNNAQATIERVLALYMGLEANVAKTILGSNGPYDLLSGLQRMGISVSTQGGSLFPETAVEVSEEPRDIVLPDSDFAESLRKHHCNALWVTPEQLDRAYDGDFATSITSNNKIASKRNLKTQTTFLSFISSLIQKYINSGGPLKEALLEEYKNAEGKADLPSFEEIISSVKAGLPTVTESIHQSHIEAYQNFSDLIDTAFQSFMSAELIDGLSEQGLSGDAIEAISLQLQSYIKRQYMTSQNMLPELSELFTKDGIIEVISALGDYNDDVLDMVGKLASMFKKKEIKTDEKIQKTIDKASEEESDNQEVSDEESAGGEETESTDDDALF